MENQKLPLFKRGDVDATSGVEKPSAIEVINK